MDDYLKYCYCHYGLRSLMLTFRFLLLHYHWMYLNSNKTYFKFVFNCLLLRNSFRCIDFFKFVTLFHFTAFLIMDLHLIIIIIQFCFNGRFYLFSPNLSIEINNFSLLIYRHHNKFLSILFILIRIICRSVYL